MADNIEVESIQYINLGDGEGNHPIDAVTVGGKTIPENISTLPAVTNSDTPQSCVERKYIAATIAITRLTKIFLFAKSFFIGFKFEMLMVNSGCKNTQKNDTKGISIY